MGEPLLVAWLLVALSAASAASCLARAKDRGEAVMGAGMAVMAVPASVLDPHRWVAPVFAVVYAAAALRALLPGTHAAGHRVHHVVCSAAMVYMAVAMAQAPPGGGHAMVAVGDVSVMPHNWRICTPCRSSKVRISDTGTAEPPQGTRRSDDTSWPGFFSR